MPAQLQDMPAETANVIRQQQAALATPAPQVIGPEKLQSDLGLLGPEELKQNVATKKVNPELERQATEFTRKLLEVKPEDEQGQDQAGISIEMIGENIARKAAGANELLKQPLKRLGQFGGGEGQGIANALTDLKVQFDEVDPSRFNFDPGWLGRFAGKLPFVGKPLNRYFTQFEASGKVIEALFDSIELSKQQLVRDIDTLRSEQVIMREATHKLQDLIVTCQLIDDKLSAKVATLDAESDEAKYINTKLIFRLRQRVTDLQQQLIVNQQGIIMFETLVENNKELVRGVNRCKNVTYPALIIGATAAQALANQKIVLDKITALDTMGDKMIAFNAKLLRTQGVDIHKRAASAQLSDTGLAQAMKDAMQALDEVQSFRMKALEQMAVAIRERSGLTATGEKAIQDMERGRKASIQLGLDNDEVTGQKNT